MCSIFPFFYDFIIFLCRYKGSFVGKATVIRISAFAPGDSMLLIIIALSLLGLGWNFGLISGTAMIVDSTETSTREKIQGRVDVLIALSGAAGGALSGMFVAGASYSTLSLLRGILSLLLIPVAISTSGKK